jgi:hypothetical protein
MMVPVSELLEIDEIEGSPCLTLYCGDLPVDAAITEVGHEPNGYFWEGIATYLEPALAARVELSSEGGMFAAYGERADLEQLLAAMTPHVADADAVVALIRRAESEGFEFDD